MSKENLMKKTVLITGGSRGLGLEFTKQYLKKVYQVISVSRNAEDSDELQKLKTEYNGRLEICQLDVSDEESRDLAYHKISDKFAKIDVLINNAGIASGNEKFRYRFGELNQEDLCRSFLVNTIAPLMITQKFYPLLEKGGDPVIANISSISGCISEKKGNGGTGYGYSSSKAALNMVTKMLSNELREKKIIVVSFHPGWVKTTMLYTDKAPLEPPESISGMIKTIESLEIDSTGKFLDWKGKEMPW
ncbi:MAG: SDR family oxidoreductase [Candidatus Hodarchaeales archaeon]|jgi:NAD(P)-dependent dehydrogenase (short-subunit alcohol dehydrogenase family)